MMMTTDWEVVVEVLVNLVQKYVMLLTTGSNWNEDDDDQKTSKTKKISCYKNPSVVDVLTARKTGFSCEA